MLPLEKGFTVPVRCSTPILTNYRPVVRSVSGLRNDNYSRCSLVYSFPRLQVYSKPRPLILWSEWSDGSRQAGRRQLTSSGGYGRLRLGSIPEVYIKLHPFPC